MILNWRKLKPDDEYPKSDAVIREFRIKLESFTDFVGRHELGALKPVTCELAYVNDISSGQGWEKPMELSNLLADSVGTHLTHAFFLNRATSSCNSSLRFQTVGPA